MPKSGKLGNRDHSRSRMTCDIDMVVALEPTDAGLMVTLFDPDYHVSRDAIGCSIRSESLFNLIHQASVIKVDCIVRKGNAYRLAEFERRQRVEIEDFATWNVSKEDLIISKLWRAKDSRSEMQLGDVRKLASTGADENYIEHWTRKLDLHNLWMECRP